MAVALGLVQAVAAGEDDVGARAAARPRARRSARIGEAEGGQLVHAVVDDRRGVEMLGEGEHHRRVEPQHGRRAHGCVATSMSSSSRSPASISLRAPPVRQARAQRDRRRPSGNG